MRGGGAQTQRKRGERIAMEPYVLREKRRIRLSSFVLSLLRQWVSYRRLEAYKVEGPMD